MAKLPALAAALLLYSPSALAWGGLGHEAICELAFLELDDLARQRVIALIQQDAEFTTFRASCNWADRPRQRASEHFVNLPRDATGLDDDDCPVAEECVVSAIDADFAVLASPNATAEAKLAALKFLGHWVGDIHQPVHAASRDDRGGNHVRTHGGSCENLHTLSDSCLVEERLGMHPLAIVPELQAGIIDEQRGWQAIRWSGPTTRRHDPRQAPGAVVPHVGILLTHTRPPSTMKFCIRSMVILAGAFPRRSRSDMVRNAPP
jgi:S1/P1 Nuclease